MTTFDRVRTAVRGLTPGYFALVMASGIVSMGLRLQGYVGMSLVLLAVGIVAFVGLVALTAWRALAYRDQLVADFMHSGRAFGFFTFIAGTNVLGTRLGMEGMPVATAVLLVVGGLSWLVLGYVIPWTAVLSSDERPVVINAHGTWFIWVVASQSVAVSAASIEPVFDAARDQLAVVAGVSWPVGVLRYAAAGICVSARLVIYELSRE